MDRSKTEHTAEFKAEVRQLLDLVVHSLYSKKEVFLRELISNASDAIDRAQFEGLTDASLIEDAPEWAIDLHLDSEAKTLRVEDNGLGMSAEEAESHLGTIARSGTRAFLDSLKAGKAKGNAPELIGQFGVGFYAAFMVAAEVTVDSLRRGMGQEAIRWHSSGDGRYHLEPGNRTEPGTSVTLKLREDAGEYADGWRIRQLVRQYSDYIAYPIRLTVLKDGKTEADNDAPLNQTKALWKRAKADIKPEEYTAFYQHISHAADEPLRSIHVQAEGTLEFQALLFVPPRAPADLFMPNAKRGLNLYVRNVFIGNHFETLMPEYLRFVTGVVDSSDLPLNVSREMLQDDAVIRRIRSNLVGRVIATLEEMRTQSPKDYDTFYRQFGAVLKEGLHGDAEHAPKLKELLQFQSLRSAPGTQLSLRAYRDAMPSKQTVIYVLICDDPDAARHSPHLEWCRDHDYDVLFLTDPVDAWILPMLDTYDGVPIRSLDRGDFQAEAGADTEDAAKPADDDTPSAAAGDAVALLLKQLKTALKDKVQDVRVSERLSQSACCLVADPNALPPGMERVLRSMGQEPPQSKRILEINPAHPLIAHLQQRAAQGEDAERLRSEGETLVALALLAEGSPVPEPGLLARRMAELMATAAQSESAATSDAAPA